MHEIDERIERLIVRRLDGELTVEEERELNQILIRTPQARRLLQDYERIDVEAASLLQEAFGSGDRARRAVAPSAGVDRSRWTRWSTWLVPAAMAASLAIVVALRWPTSPPSGGGGDTNQPKMVRQTLPPSIPGRDPLLARAPTEFAGYRQDRAIQERAVYLLAADGTIFVLRGSHEQTLRWPSGQSLIQNVSDDL